MHYSATKIDVVAINIAIKAFSHLFLQIIILEHIEIIEIRLINSIREYYLFII